MNKYTIFTLIAVFLTNISFAQDRERYAELIDEAMELYYSKEYLKSGQKYAEAFVTLGNKGFVSHRYNAACSWALANQLDSSFAQLFKIVETTGYADLMQITMDKDLNALHPDKRWNELIEIIKRNKAKAEENLNQELVAILDTIYREDQTYRRQIGDIEKKYGMKSDEMKAHWKLIQEKDSINLIKVMKILDERGWLGADSIGDRGNRTLFLVIQHADLQTQLKYLDMMREAVRKGNASASSLALLEDRVALRQGKRQIYGSQIGRDPETGEHYVLPLDDVDNVDKRRAEVGLGTLQEYVSRWGITWDVEEYKKQLPELESKGQ